jgi:dUTP pyrophosphatase
MWFFNGGIMQRGFEIISYDQYKKDIIDNYDDYQSLKIPKRSTTNSAGYDFLMPFDLLIKPGETKKVPTGIKAKLNNDEVLFIIIRSSLGYKHDIVLSNQVGVIDSDYYGNIDNEGHIFIPIKNIGDKEYEFKKNDAFAQGIFNKYLKSDNEEEVTTTRSGGFGSTNKE